MPDSVYGARHSVQKKDKMKIRSNQKHRKATAFTLIEMIGVLAVIAILMSLLIPKVFEAINNSRINNACLSYNTVKTALADHYAKFGTILSSNGIPITASAGEAMNYDRVLLTEGFLDKPFVVKIGDGITNHVEVVTGLATNIAPTAINAAFDLDGTGTQVNDAGPAGAAVVVAVITSVTINDAKDLNDRLDGTALGTGTPPDLVGRVKYAAPGANGLTDVHIYVTHR